jgi:hypothetical protein
MGLGSYPDITRGEPVMSTGVPPVKGRGNRPDRTQTRCAGLLRREAAKQQALTFDECASAYVASHSDA